MGHESRHVLVHCTLQCRCMECAYGIARRRCRYSLQMFWALANGPYCTACIQGYHEDSRDVESLNYMDMEEENLWGRMAIASAIRRRNGNRGRSRSRRGNRYDREYVNWDEIDMHEERLSRRMAIPSLSRRRNVNRRRSRSRTPNRYDRYRRESQERGRQGEGRNARYRRHSSERY